MRSDSFLLYLCWWKRVDQRIRWLKRRKASVSLMKNERWLTSPIFRIALLRNKEWNRSSIGGATFSLMALSFQRAFLLALSGGAAGWARETSTFLFIRSLKQSGTNCTCYR